MLPETMVLVELFKSMEPPVKAPFTVRAVMVSLMVMALAAEMSPVVVIAPFLSVTAPADVIAATVTAAVESPS